jgi:hypothetical protein
MASPSWESRFLPIGTKRPANKEGLGNYLMDVKYDDPSETKGGAVVITGTGKGKKSGVDVVFGKLAALFFFPISKIAPAMLPGTGPRGMPN